MKRLLGPAGRPFIENFVAVVGAMTALAAATVWVARTGGPVAVGDYALLRILPWLFAVIVSGGLAGSITYFLAGPTQKDPRVRSTVIGIALVSGVAAALLWVLGTPVLHAVFFRQTALMLVPWVAVRVALRLVVITGKAAAQGSGDPRGSNVTILLEELMFLPAYGVTQAIHMQGDAALIAGLVLADLATGSIAWARLLSRGFIAGAAAPSFELARRIYMFGVRGQVGTLMQLLNLRFNVVVLAALAGPATLGIYAVASKYSETLRMVPIAANWVLYPRFARADPSTAVESSRRLILRAGALTAGAALPLAIAAGFVIPPLFGASFTGAVLPARLLLIGLAAEGVGGIVSAFLYGRGHPGLNSLGAGAGVVVTLILDVFLIPRYGAVGAAVASSAAYLTTTATLVAWYRHLAKKMAPPNSTSIFVGLPSIPPSVTRRVLDVAVSLFVLVASWPVLLALLVAARLSTKGPAIFSQVRVGQGGMPFTMYKIRSMRPNCGGPEITGPADRRITRLGAVLRATSLDELPQLLNVLRGEMTLVGPRPETVHLAARYPAEAQQIFAFRPGLTGPVQVRMRDVVPDQVDDIEDFYLTELLPRRTSLDLAYLHNPSFGATLGLLSETAAHVLKRMVRKFLSRSRRRTSIVGGLEESAT